MLANRRATISGLGIDLWTAGEGRDLLFLHPGSGWGDHGEFLDVLSGSFRVTAAAHPGFEGSDNLECFTGVDDLALFYLDLVEQLGLERPLVVGSSFGAWIAAEMAIRCKPACSALVLIGPVGAKFGGEREREITDLFSYPIYEQDRFLFSDPRFTGRSHKAAEDAALIRMARNFESFARLGWSPTLYDPKLRHWLARLTMPVLVLRGEADRVVSEGYCRNFAAAIPAARFAGIPDAGHYADVEQPARVIEAIRTFAASSARAGARTEA
jgi:pimeloyl-ACP methyl ester carboxylesterase